MFLFDCGGWKLDSKFAVQSNKPQLHPYREKSFQDKDGKWRFFFRSKAVLGGSKSKHHCNFILKFFISTWGSWKSGVKHELSFCRGLQLQGSSYFLFTNLPFSKKSSFKISEFFLKCVMARAFNTVDNVESVSIFLPSRNLPELTPYCCVGLVYAHLKFITQTKSCSYTLTQSSSSQFQPVEPTVLGLLVHPYCAIKNKNNNTVIKCTMYKLLIK